MNNFFKHLHTINSHRFEVCKSCFKMGIPWLGLIHDLSKYSWKEFSIYKYYNGKRSPHDEARDILGYSPSWLYHKSKNKHHWEFWLDNQDGDDFIPIKIPYKYVVEMFCDMVGAGKAYLKDKWTVSSPKQYYDTRCKGQRLMHSKSEELLTTLLRLLSECEDEKQFFNWYKKNKNIMRAIYE